MMAMTEDERRERRRVAARRKRAENPESARAADAQMRLKRGDLLKARAREKYAADPERERARKRAYVEANREKEAARRAANRATRPDVERGHQAAYAARHPARLAAKGARVKAERNALALDAAGFRCGACSASLDMAFYGVRGALERPVFPRRGGCLCWACAEAGRPSRSESAKRARAAKP